MRRLRDFLAAAGGDADFTVRVFGIGEGAALCAKGAFSAEEDALLAKTGAEIPFADCFPAEEE